ncbi:MAG: hypothetical protein A2174_00095 [Candidatus Portnoybacteria bacterium RBG_13_41_18]|uniref:Uncharacterized protein n=1 Tax=Candidatus Portnoybacteria bacterium RBG_13_41_18 TaxID=1801991 RepID=A0A1G2FBG3_9BACT|nr:MAG: hypothetical protein A2174_00095 [Candidatus Portnoybacteria bacterium RBG_13_41_18]
MSVELNKRLFFKSRKIMAKNGPKGGGREGMVKSRVQYKNPRTKLFTKADTKSGRFMDDKTSMGKLSKFKGVRTK